MMTLKVMLKNVVSLTFIAPNLIIILLGTMFYLMFGMHV